MLLLPLAHDGRLDLLVILEEDNISRIKEYDPAQVNWQQITIGKFSALRPGIFHIAYIAPSDTAKLHNFIMEGKVGEAVKLLTSGFKFRPEAGDHDRGPLPIAKA